MNKQKRNIQFRGKRIEDNKWIYGYLASNDFINNINEIAVPSEEVYTETIGQFTEVYDVNGTPIFEGDIVETFTISLKQEYPLLVEHKVERDKTLKYIRAVRIILSYLSHTIYRKQIKSALKGTWKERIKVLEEIDLNKIDFDNLGKHNNKLDVLKIIAFQIGQCWGLMEDTEYYTKYAIVQDYPFLKRFLYRKETEIINLNIDLHMFVEDLKYAVKPEDILKYDLKNEKRNG